MRLYFCLRFKKGPAGRCGEGSTVGNANRSRPHALTSPVHCKCHIKLIFGVDALKLKKLLQNIDFDDDEDDFNTGDDNDGTDFVFGMILLFSLPLLYTNNRGFPCLIMVAV